MPAPTITGFPASGPIALESVLKRKLNSHALLTLPSAVFTAYVSPQCVIEITSPSLGAFLRSTFADCIFIMPPPCGGLVNAFPSETTLR